MNPLKLRRARPGEGPLLTALVLRSKAYWGYSPEFIEACRAELTIDDHRISTEWIVVAEIAGRVVGVSSTIIEDEEAELSDLFVEPDYVGSGVGEALWNHACAAARAAGAKILLVESDPHAVGFYEAMGCVQVGEAPSGSIPGRYLPLMKVRLDSGTRA